MPRCFLTVPIVALLAANLAPHSGAAATFVKVADTSTAIPGGTGSFKSFGRNPSVEGTHVAFRGEGDPVTPAQPQQQGVYSTRSGSLDFEADQNSLIPDGAGNFETFSFEPSLGGAAAAWNGDGSGAQEGIYWESGSGPARVADRTTPLPSGQAGELFHAFVYSPVTAAGQVVFRAAGDGGALGPVTEGIYRFDAGSLDVVVDTQTPMPGIGDAYAFVSLPDVDASGNVAFRGRSAAGFDGVYRFDTALTTLANENMPSPSSGLAFQSFGGDPAIDAGKVLFQGTDTAGLTGLYLHDGTLQIIADQNTPIPGAGGSSFEIFGHYSHHGGVIAFEGIGLPGSEVGLYTSVGGVLTKLIDKNDLLDGKAISEFEISRESLANNQLAFWVRFTDNSEGIYVALPEPAALPALLAGAALLVALRRQRWH